MGGAQAEETGLRIATQMSAASAGRSPTAAQPQQARHTHRPVGAPQRVLRPQAAQLPLPGGAQLLGKPLQGALLAHPADVGGCSAAHQQRPHVDLGRRRKGLWDMGLSMQCVV